MNTKTKSKMNTKTKSKMNTKTKSKMNTKTKSKMNTKTKSRTNLKTKSRTNLKTKSRTNIRSNRNIKRGSGGNNENIINENIINEDKLKVCKEYIKSHIRMGCKEKDIQQEVKAFDELGNIIMKIKTSIDRNLKLAIKSPNSFPATYQDKRDIKNEIKNYFNKITTNFEFLKEDNKYKFFDLNEKEVDLNEELNSGKN